MLTMEAFAIMAKKMISFDHRDRSGRLWWWGASAWSLLPVPGVGLLAVNALDSCESSLLLLALCL